MIDVATGAERTLHTSASGFPPERLVASADGEYLAWSERGEELFVVPSAGGAPALVVDDFNLSGFVWAGTRTLAFALFDSGLHFYDADSGAVSDVPGTEGMTNLASLGPEGVVSAIRAQSLFWILPGGRVMELGEKPDRLDLELLAWSSDLHFVGTTDALSLLTVEPPGRFALEVRLVPGMNRLAARAVDGRGNQSPDSEVLEVSFENASLPDLIVDGALGIVPSAPVSGESASVSVPIRNIGSVPSEATVVSVTGADEGGSLYAVGTRAVPALAPGASVTVSLPWPTEGRLGPQTLEATVDPLSLVDESNEENNAGSAPATVVGTETLALSISLGRGSYGARETAEITISAVNGGPARTFVLETVIEDGEGTPVAIVDSRSASLGYANSLRYAVFWNTGAVLAGNYVARVRAFGATAASPFTIARTLD
ncbi:MAG: CARDB domain-containing protein, partial [Vicinamibacteria bacterium]